MTIRTMRDMLARTRFARMTATQLALLAVAIVAGLAAVVEFARWLSVP